ncbi:MAG: nucleotidyltransferase family protein [Clostridium sp.]|nr:nucleotidyltransferase family protein [Clostridium sp.]
MITGIICEFNPFHSGHKYLIDTIKKDSDGVVCVMSGNIVQRGEFAVFDKFTRARTAIQNGADLVIELPCSCSSLSAEGFAKAGVKLLEDTNAVDEIAFGAECDCIDELKALAYDIENSQDLIVKEMKKGISYPVARKNVIKSELLDGPNNILALEYIKASALPCRAIKRIGKGHDTDDKEYSASAIRQTLSPDAICSMKNCETAVLAKLRTMQAEDFLNIDDVNEGLENRIADAVRISTSLEELYSNIKTKRYTHSRIRRIILRSYLGITANYKKTAPYIRILGFNEKGRDILAEIKKNANLPIISRYNDIANLDDYGKSLFALECKCTDLFNLGYKNPLPCGTEQRSKIIIL